MKKKDRLFAKSPWLRVFEFNREVASVFDDMAERSIPHYKEVLEMTARICHRLMPRGGYIYDLGCSTANLFGFLSIYFEEENFQYIGIDSSQAMIDKARQKYKKKQNIQLLYADINELDFPHASAIIANYTLQFINPSHRLKILKNVYASLLPKGIFIASEKIKDPNAEIDELFQEFYYNFKKEMRYSDQEIARKREALENILIPLSLKANLKLVKKAGFNKISLFFKWYNFASFLAIKD
ncbi:MAG: carboxy-S-adenosyl-L-methionine synthase CmoA [Leptospiraceae bacterium]|nr:carboxy-S-adenosyl-L-methionine synthase CmoA [Leptospiraceae bacterium]MDW8306116.1 carboxy-S-adenosyl-L-methionine synthase CmoA [Leptospiraceae bacterium]